MSDIHRSFVSSSDYKKVVTIKNDGLIIQYPGFFRGKPHHVAYNEISHSTITNDENVTIYLKNNRTFIFDGLSKYECKSLNLAIIEGAKGPLSKNTDYLAASEENSEKEDVAEKKNNREKLYWEIGIGVALLILFVVALIFSDDKRVPLPWEDKADTESYFESSENDLEDNDDESYFESSENDFEDNNDESDPEYLNAMKEMYQDLKNEACQELDKLNKK